MNPLSRTPRRALTCALAAITALGAGAATASAATFHMDGDTLVFTAAPGALNNWPHFDGGIGDDGLVLRVSESLDRLEEGAGCVPLDPPYNSEMSCPMPARLRVELGDGEDRITLAAGLPPIPVEVLGQGGNDGLSANDDVDNRVVLDGGEGDDGLDGYKFSDVLRGGPGNDKLYGRGGDDELRGGEGDDELQPDTNVDVIGNDIVDGGPGYDKAKDWYSSSEDPAYAVSVSVDGVANDGRPGGEADNVTNVERIDGIEPGHYVFGDTDDSIDLPDFGTSILEGRGGKDTLTGGDGVETVDGGPGDDRLEGGYNHDTITGGPGKDTIYGDETSQRCSFLSNCVVVPYGNDTINARDGEADVIDCGVGNDKAVVDAIDVISNCEDVDGQGGGGPGGSGGGGVGGGEVVTPKPPAKKCQVQKVKVKGLTLSKAKAKLRKAKCAKVKVAKTKVKSKTVKKGRVVRATAKGTTATVVISRGRR
jgi:Ca2+-binding RTX toxin-like protein